jgi:hypothetical protein
MERLAQIRDAEIVEIFTAKRFCPKARGCFKFSSPLTTRNGLRRRFNNSKPIGATALRLDR